MFISFFVTQITTLIISRGQLGGWSKKIQEQRKMEIIPRQIFINPTLQIADNKQVGETCGLDFFRIGQRASNYVPEGSSLPSRIAVFVQAIAVFDLYLID